MLKLMTRHRLLWKIILIFWLTTLCTIVANIYITREIAHTEFKSEHFKTKTKLLAEDAVQVYEDEGIRSLKKWYRYTLKTDGLNVALLDKNSKRVGGRSPWKVNERENSLFNESEQFKKHLLNLADHKVISTSGNEYTLRILPSPALRAKFNPDTLHFYRLLSSFVIIFIGSFCLYRSIARPLKVLQDASKALSNGDFSVRVMHTVGSRKDELGELAKAFDQMAIKIDALLDSQKQLFRDISHEIRTPLTRQKLAIELAKDSQTPLVFLDKIEHQNNNINALIDNLLTFIKLEDTNIRNIETFDLSQSMQNVINEAELDLAVKNIELHSRLDADCMVRGNIILITRALENIFMNAIKYSPDNGLITIQVCCEDKLIKLILSDQGPGIPEVDLDSIFKPFYRSDQSRNQKTGGFGLGLAITQKIVQQHNGQLSISNIQPRGLKLTIGFQLDKATDK